MHLDEHELNNQDNVALWLAHNDESPEDQTCFWYSEGNIDTKNPDGETLKKALSIARALNAKVQGDDGETYDEDGNPHDEAPAVTDEAQVRPTKPWWKFW